MKRKRYTIFELRRSHYLSKHFTYAVLDNDRAGTAVAYCFNFVDALKVKEALNLMEKKS